MSIILVRRRRRAPLILSLLLQHRLLAATPTSAQTGSEATGLVGAVSRNTVTLSWFAPAAPVAPVVGYQLDVGFAPGATNAVLPLGNVLTFTAVAPDGSLRARPRHLDERAERPVERGGSGHRTVVPPAAPLDLASSVVNTSVFLQWTPNPAGAAVTTYVLEAGSAPGLSNLATLSFSPATLSFGRCGAPRHLLRAPSGPRTPPGSVRPSNEVVVVAQPPVCTPPGAPTGLNATTAAGAVSLSWLAPVSGGAPTGYRLDVGSSSGASNIGSFPLPAQTGISTPAPAGTYFVRVVATNACGNSPPSAQISFTIVPPVPSLVGTWDGVVFNHPGSFGHGPLTAFVLTITRQPTPATSPAVARGLTTSAAGRTSSCHTSRIAGAATVSIESLACNDGDFVLTIAARRRERRSGNVPGTAAPFG